MYLLKKLLIIIAISFSVLSNNLFAQSEKYIGIGTGFSVTSKSVKGESEEVYWKNPSTVISDYKYKPGFQFNFMNIWDSGYIFGFIFDYNSYSNIKNQVVSEFGAQNYYEFKTEKLAFNLNFGYIYDFNYFISTYALAGLQYNNYINRLSETRYSGSNNLIGGGFSNDYKSTSLGLAFVAGALYRLNDLLSANVSVKYYYNSNAGVIQTDATNFYIQDKGLEASIVFFITF